jgi:hypothetical protein
MTNDEHVRYAIGKPTHPEYRFEADATARLPAH